MGSFPMMARKMSLSIKPRFILRDSDHWRMVKPLNSPLWLTTTVEAKQRMLQDQWVRLSKVLPEVLNSLMIMAALGAAILEETTSVAVKLKACMSGVLFIEK